MKQIHYDAVRETLYYEQLDNGLELYVLPKTAFSKTYATFTTRYGSIDNHFQVEGGEPIRVPDGIAHFLEHKDVRGAGRRCVCEIFCTRGVRERLHQF